MEIVSVNQNNIHLLNIFIDNLGNASASFRYYNKRNVQAINNHLVTLLMFKEKLPVAYGHLDIENETIWLGICVLPPYFKKGFGSRMMDELIGFARKSSLTKIYLTVDKNNNAAIRLYEKFNFIKEGENENSYKYSLCILT